MRFAKAFRDFLWDFVIADTPEIAIGVLLIMGLAFAIHSVTMAAVIIVPLVVVALLWYSIRRGVNEAIH